MNFKGLIIVLQRGNVQKLKKRENIRKMHKLAMMGMDHVLKRDQAKIGEKFPDACALYYSYAKEYCLSKGDLVGIQEKF